jgi:hypothetical protein
MKRYNLERYYTDYFDESLAEFRFKFPSFKPRVPKPPVPGIRQLAEQTAITRTLPKPSVLKRSVGQLGLTALRNPRQAIQTVKQTVPYVRQVAGQMGYTLPGMARRATRYVTNSTKPLVKDLAVNTGGYVGSRVGYKTGGVPGSLAGDYLGAYVTRRGIDDTGSLIRNTRRAFRSPTYRGQGLGTRLRGIQQRVTNNAMRRYVNNDDLLGDATGYAIGNTIANAADGVPIPLKGGLTAMATNDIAVKGVKELGQGQPLNTVLGNTGRRLYNRFNPSYQIKKGLARERLAFQRVNRKLRRSNNV